MCVVVFLVPAALARAQDVPPTDEPPMAPPPAQVIALDAGDFAVRAGDTLRDSLLRWGDSSGHRVIWELDADYPIATDYALPPGTSFPDAAREMIKAFQGRDPAPKGCVYNNHVLLVRERGDACPR